MVVDGWWLALGRRECLLRQRTYPMMRRSWAAVFGSQQFGLIVVILLLCALLTGFSGSFNDHGRSVNNFLNAGTLIQVLTDSSFFAVMAVGATIVIISGGIDLSVGSTYALAGVLMAMVLRGHHDLGAGGVLGAGLLCAGIGIACGAANGLLICSLGVHPFIITLGTMLVYRGISFVSSRAESILVPQSLTAFAKARLGLPGQLHPIPMLVMIGVAVLGWVFLTRTVAGRRIFAVGGNLLASKYSGLRVTPILIGVYAISGLTAGIAAYVGASFYGAASSADGTSYELFVIASAVVGGASLTGGKGSAISAMLGALLISLMRQSVRSLHFDQNYESIIIGCAIIVAVVLDRVSARLGSRRFYKKQA